MSENCFHRLVAEQKFPKSNINLLEKGNPPLLRDGFEIWIQDNRTGQDEVLKIKNEDEAVKIFDQLCRTMDSVGELDKNFMVFTLQYLKCSHTPTHIYFYGKHHDLCWIEPYKK